MELFQWVLPIGEILKMSIGRLLYAFWIDGLNRLRLVCFLMVHR